MAALEKDPVCGKEVDPDAVLTSGATRFSHEGKRYYFCGLLCRNKFVANPEGYLNPEQAKT
ncbi:MAG: YHS domain-containing protein [Chloroflexi bacterium]|nr:YHS domain-containing protein [Chloroflexota bacterium]